MNTRLNRLNTMRQRRHKKPDPVVPYMTLAQCFETIIEHGKHSKALNYCVNYAERALEVDKLRDVVANYAYAMQIQLLYVLRNMTHWRGETATNVRVNLRAHLKQLDDLKKEH